MEIKAKFRYLSNQLKRLNNEDFRKIMSHPFLLLMVGAIVSSIIIPNFTRQWQDNEKQLELKTALADDINKAVSDSVVSTRLVDRFNEKDFDDSFRSWQISKEMIGSKIEAYFSDDSIRQNWDNLSSAAEEYSYYIAGYKFPQQNYTTYYYDVCNRLAHILKVYTSYSQDNPINIDRNVLNKYHCNQFYIHILNPQNFAGWKKDQKYFPIRDNKSIDWDALFYYNQTNINEYMRSISILNKDIEDHKNNLLQSIFKSDITAFK